MRFPWTPKPRSASLDELRDQLANARASYTSAQVATQSAETAFDDNGEASAEKALLSARSAEQSAYEHLARAERLVEAAEAQRRVEERARMQARRAELENKTALPALLAMCDSDLQRAAEALVAFVDARVTLARRAVEFAALEAELASVTIALGDEPRGIVALNAYLAASPGSILMRLTPRLERLPGDHPLHRAAQWLSEVGPCHYTGTPDA